MSRRLARKQLADKDKSKDLETNVIVCIPWVDDKQHHNDNTIYCVVDNPPEYQTIWQTSFATWRLHGGGKDILQNVPCKCFVSNFMSESKRAL